MFIKIRALRHCYQGFDGKEWANISYELFTKSIEEGAQVVGFELDNDYNEEIVTTPHR